MTKTLKYALGVIPALFLCSAALDANDGMEFHQIRPAGPADGKMLTVKDVVYRGKLAPQETRNHFKEKTPEFPKCMTKDSSLYLIANEGDTLLVARGGNGIVYGTAVSRHEFGIDRGTFLSPDRSKVAFYRKDESEVHRFPLLDITKPGGSLIYIRYPMAGGKSEKISVEVYDFTTKQTITLDTERETQNNSYLTNITWSPESEKIYIQVLDRSQQNLQLNEYDATSGRKTGTILTEHSDTWVEPQYTLQWIKGSNRECIYSTDNRDGWWNLYLLNVKSKTVKRLAKFDKDMKYLANDGRYVYFTAPDIHPVNNYLWRASIKTGKVEQLTKETGWHRIEMAPDCKTYVDVYQSLTQVPVSRLKSVNGKTIETLAAPEDPTKDYAYGEIVMGTVTSANGEDLNYYRMIKPLGFDPQKKYPLILYVYGGPHSQLVTNTFLGGLRRWEMYMAQKGYVVFVMDNRGTQRHRAAYEHSIYRQCGRNEMEDQMQAVNMLLEIPWIDKDRVGVCGWSYGGFMSISLATNYPDVFKVATAGGPVIDWKWYEVMYGERYMSTPQDNPEGYEKTSLLNKAGDLKARLLVIEGGNDDTVVPQHALSFLQKCIDKGVKVDYFTYPKAAHNMRDTDREHLIDKISDYFLDNL